MKHWDRRSVPTGLGSIGASSWIPPSADALGLADDKIKRVSSSTPSPGRSLLLNRRPDGSFTNW